MDSLSKADCASTDIDDILVRFEKAAEKQVSSKESPVKCRAAERDLLTVAECGRNLLEEAMKGDKLMLTEMFGGTSQRFQRFKHVLDIVDFSPMHERDQRWQHLRDVILTIEEILKQLGVFKKLPSSTVHLSTTISAPRPLTYPELPHECLIGDRACEAPEVHSSSHIVFSAQQCLPKSLDLDTKSGTIAGGPSEAAKTENTTTAMDADGQTIGSGSISSSASSSARSTITPAGTMAHEFHPEKRYSTSWVGHFEQGGKHEMEFRNLVIDRGTIQGTGSDVVGRFELHGTVQGDVVSFKKQYIKKHTVMYRGQIKKSKGGQMITGTWNFCDGQAGGPGQFELEQVESLLQMP